MPPGGAVNRQRCCTKLLSRRRILAWPKHLIIERKLSLRIMPGHWHVSSLFCDRLLRAQAGVCSHVTVDELAGMWQPLPFRVFPDSRQRCELTSDCKFVTFKIPEPSHDIIWRGR